MGHNELLYTAIYQTAAETGKYFAVDGNTVQDFAKKNFLFCRQFVIKTDAPATDTEAQVKAESIYARLKAGEDAAAILRDHESDDKVVGAYYCFAETEDFAALSEDAVALLEPGEISDVRMDGEGFHIIVRLEADDEYLDENLTEGVFESYCMHQLTLMQNEIKDAYEVRYINKKTPDSYR
jgi:parvulin-like peptidyl-prolyl isomerase